MLRDRGSEQIENKVYRMRTTVGRVHLQRRSLPDVACRFVNGLPQEEGAPVRSYSTVYLRHGVTIRLSRLLDKSQEPRFRLRDPVRSCRSASTTSSCRLEKASAGQRHRTTRFCRWRSSRQYPGRGLITNGERYNKVIADLVGSDRESMPTRCSAMMMERDHQGAGATSTPILHHGRLGRARQQAADPTTGRDAGADGQAIGRDHRDSDHLQLPRRAQRCSSTSSRRTAPGRGWRTLPSRRRTRGISPGGSSTWRKTSSSRTIDCEHA